MASRRRSVFATLLMAVITTLCLSLSSGVALADHGRQEHQRTADVTFTKWIVSVPANPPSSAGDLMAGVVGGDVGRGVYAGQILDDDLVSQPGFWLGHARYEFHGWRHTFVADMHITENDSVVPITATLQGVVTSGWLRGAQVTGVYTQYDTCPIPTPGNVFGTVCFQGTLQLERDHRRRN